MIYEMIRITLERFLQFLPVLAIAIVVARVTRSYISEEQIGMFLKAEKRNIVRASLLGLVTPGLLSLYLPLLKVMQIGGLPLSIIATFITSQTLVGPVRAFLEIEMFGLTFFISRVIISFFIAIGVGACFQKLNRYIKPKILSENLKNKPNSARAHSPTKRLTHKVKTSPRFSSH